MWSSRDPSLREEPFHSSLDCSVKQVRNGNKLQKEATSGNSRPSLQQQAALITAAQDVNSFFSTFRLSHGDYQRQKVEISVPSLVTSDLISSFKTFDESIRTMLCVPVGDWRGSVMNFHL